MKAMILVGVLAATPLAHAQNGMPDTMHGGAMSGMGHGAAAGAMASAPKDVSVQDCWIRLLPGKAPSGGYFTIKNAGTQPITLTGVRTEAFGMAMLHQTSADEQGVMGMSAVHDVQVPAQSELAFKPGGYHVMLENPVKPPQAGDKMPLTLVFGDQALTTQCEVRSPAAAK